VPLLQEPLLQELLLQKPSQPFLWLSPVHSLTHGPACPHLQLGDAKKQQPAAFGSSAGTGRLPPAPRGRTAAPSPAPVLHQCNIQVSPQASLPPPGINCCALASLLTPGRMQDLVPCLW
jgi:hypothetical protein